MMKAAGMVVEDSMSNLTSGSNDASISSGNRLEIGAVYPQQQQLPPLASSPTNQSAQPASKKKRNLPGNPDPEAEVIALSPRTLLATNRFICEICNKGFQRDQNLQLHRRGHNLPWKLKQRSNKEVIRKKVYICPETTCVHHDPSRALGDLTGVKKHFSRKHGEKKWKCEKCSKRYAVQSDWKAHSKICGTREYRCDCGTLFSRRDSFITHRAFCDALAEESARAITTNNHPLGLLGGGGNSTTSSVQLHLQNHPLHGGGLPVFPLKREQDQLQLQLQRQQSFNSNLRPPELPPWLSDPGEVHQQVMTCSATRDWTKP
nr:protein indeterminate-domain 7-like isoform X1 [Coffea arabica]